MTTNDKQLVPCTHLSRTRSVGSVGMPTNDNQDNQLTQSTNQLN